MCHEFVDCRLQPGGSRSVIAGLRGDLAAYSRKREDGEEGGNNTEPAPDTCHRLMTPIRTRTWQGHFGPVPEGRGPRGSPVPSPDLGALLDMGEICRGIDAREAVRLRTLGSVDDLKAAIAQCPDDGNDRRQPRVDQDRRSATRTLPPEQGDVVRATRGQSRPDGRR